MSGATRTATPRSKGEAKLKASTKSTIRIDSSFTAAKWPTIDPAQQDMILKLLCRLLEPLGHHRTVHVTPSRGRRPKKRKRTPAKADHAQVEMPGPGKKPIPSPPPPLIAKHITVGYNSTFRHLQGSIKQSQPEGMTKDETLKNHSSEEPNLVTKNPEARKGNYHAQEIETKPRHLSAIFLTAPHPSNHIPYTPLPLLTTLASTRHPKSPATRLISLSTNSETKLCATLSIPRVGIIGLFDDAPGATGLVEYLLENVEVVEVPWAEEVGKGEWLGAKISFGEGGREVQ